MRTFKDDGSSITLATVFLIAITLILAAMVLLILEPFPHCLPEEPVPAIFEITNIRHTNDYGQMVEEGWVVLKNTDILDYKNSDMFVLTYVNGKKIPAEIPTLNADQLAQTVGHNGVQLLYGSGSSGSRKKQTAYWVSGSKLAINYNNHFIRPGDVVTIEIYNALSKKIISRDTYPHKEESKQEMMMKEYFNRQGV